MVGPFATKSRKESGRRYSPVNMYRFIDTENRFLQENMRIDGDMFHHIVRVLRMREGDRFELQVGEELALVQIEEMGEDFMQIKVLEKREDSSESPLKIHLVLCIPKSDKFENVVQRAVELGAVEIIPVLSARTIVRLDEKAKDKKQARWQDVAKAAAQQSKRQRIPHIARPMTWKEVIRHLEGKTSYLFYEGGGMSLRDFFQKKPEDEDIYLVIGPEGGFTDEEVEEAEELMPILSLGPRILRVETAALSAVALFQYEWGDMST